MKGSGSRDVSRDFATNFSSELNSAVNWDNFWAKGLGSLDLFWDNLLIIGVWFFDRLGDGLGSLDLDRSLSLYAEILCRAVCVVDVCEFRRDTAGLGSLDFVSLFKEYLLFVNLSLTEFNVDKLESLVDEETEGLGSRERPGKIDL
jgi:hypothetical protein